MIVVDIFISYERSDRPRAGAIANALEGQGWSVWWDRKLSGGERFDRIIQRELDTARCVVVLWSSTSIDSDWVRDEAAEGLKRSVLIPARIDDVRVPLGFRQLHTIDLIGSTSERANDELFDSVRRVLEAPVRPASTGNRTVSSVRRRRSLLAGVAALAVVLAVGAALVYYWPRSVPAPAPTAATAPALTPTTAPATSPATANPSADAGAATSSPAARRRDQPSEQSRVETPTPGARTQPCVVRLATPADNATLIEQTIATGAREDGTWLFGWRDCSEASRYHLYIIGPRALNPIVDADSLTNATYRYRQSGRLTQFEGWTWKVRAYVDSQWGPWSEERTFNIARPPADQDSASTGSRATSGQSDPRDTQVLRSAADTVSRGRIASEGPGLAVFEVPYTFDRAHTRPMYVQVRIYGEAEETQPGRRPRRPLIGVGRARVSTPSGTVSVDVRKQLGVAARSSFIEATLLEEAVPLKVQQWPETRLWGP